MSATPARRVPTITWHVSSPRSARLTKLFREKVSDKNITDRTELDKMLGYVRDGDVFRVKSGGRLASSTIELLTLVRHLGE